MRVLFLVINEATDFEAKSVEIESLSLLHCRLTKEGHLSVMRTGSVMV
jgi:hypothetical protein